MEVNTLFYLALILFSGLLFGRIVKLIKLPNVTGYLIAGLLIGPYGFKLVPMDMVEGLKIISEIALAFIAFTIGSEFKLSYLRKAGVGPMVIAIFESGMATLLVSVALLAFGFQRETSLLLGAIAAATAPAATVMVIKQYDAKGPVTKMLLSVVALDDATCIMLFGIIMAVVNSMLNPGKISVAMSVIMPLVEIIASLLLGAVLGFLITIPMRFFKKNSNRLIIICAFVFLGSAVASMFNLSGLLLCMAMGAALINFSPEGENMFRLADYLTPPIFVMFFVASGMELNIGILPSVGLMSVIYIVVRVIGKVLGATLGAVIVKAEDSIKKYLGFSLVPQAGVAIGLSLIAANTLPEFGPTIRTIVLCATLIYELTGPVITKISLKKAGEIKG